MTAEQIKTESARLTKQIEILKAALQKISELAGPAKLDCDDIARWALEEVEYVG